ncbi:MAG: hypothetical protein ACMXYD_00460 [Candidatus Woesearchaeota archaeon]
MASETQTRTENEQYIQPLMDKAFFGKDNCLTVQLRAKNVYFKWGKKVGEQWEWKNVKFSDVELGDILRLLQGDVSEVKFYHSFNEESTQIWGSRLKDKVVLKAADYTKGLSAGEQKVLEVLLTHAIWMMNV